MDLFDSYSQGAAFSGLQNPGMSESYAFRGGEAPAYKPGLTTPIHVGERTAVHAGEHIVEFTSASVSRHSSAKHVAELHSSTSVGVGHHVDVAA